MSTTFEVMRSLSASRRINDRACMTAYLVEAHDDGRNALVLSNLGLSDDDIVNLCDWLKSHPRVNRLDLHGNRISDRGAKALSKVPSIHILNLANNPIQCSGAEALADSRSLSELDLSNTQIAFSGIKALLASQTLLELDVQNTLAQVYCRVKKSGGRHRLADYQITAHDTFEPLFGNQSLSRLKYDDCALDAEFKKSIDKRLHANRLAGGRHERPTRDHKTSTQMQSRANPRADFLSRPARPTDHSYSVVLRDRADRGTQASLSYGPR